MGRKMIASTGAVAGLAAMIVVTMLTLLGLAALTASDDEVVIAGNELQEARAFYAAEAGLETAAATIHAAFDSTGAPPNHMPAGSLNLNNCNVAYITVDGGATSQRMLTNGTFAGLHALVKSYLISSVARSEMDRTKVRVSETFHAALVPIFQFAVFYGKDLEIAPGPEMTLRGRVHSNGNLWLQANNVLRLDSYITASGNIFHGRKGTGGGGRGDVLIKDANGEYVSMRMESDWLDSQDPDWYDSSMSRWQGRVQDAAHGQGELNLPLTAGADPHDIIERADGNPNSYENLSTLRFVDGSALRWQEGAWIDVTADMISKGILTRQPDQFQDQREDEWVDVTEVDLKKLYDEGYGPANGVIYFTDATEDFPALRLKNGTEIDDPRGLTVASENPVYTLGDYNSINKKPCAIMADAITFLSNNWMDSGYDALSNSHKSDRPARETTVNTCYLTGNIETSASDFNGGFEDLPRYLEDWSNAAFNWKGSAVSLWSSQQATGTSNRIYYTPPCRNWQYDTDLDNPANLPPESPRVRVYQRTGWKQEYIAYELDRAGS